MLRLFLCIFGLVSFMCAGQYQDFTHMSVSITPVPAQNEIRGIAELFFVAEEPQDSIYLNGVKINYHSVRLNNDSVSYGYNDQGIWLMPERQNLKDTNHITITYDCQPRKGLFFIGWDDETGQSPKQIWTQGQGIDHRHWIPHKDDQTDKLTMDIRVEFDAGYEVISNGELVEVKEGEVSSNWHYRMDKPMSSYLIALVIGQYDSKATMSKSRIPLTQYYYPDREGDYEWYYAHNEEIFNFLQEEVGVAFPWANYKQVPVKNFHHGAMENTTATIFGDFFLVDEIAFNDRNYTYVNAHELAHQWFGNLVTAIGSDHHWLHEGFATYYQWLSEENLYGQDHFDWLRWTEAQLVFEASRNDSIPLGNGKAGSYRFYQKGAWVLYMLKQKLGKRKFDMAIQHYLQKNAFGVVNTDSLNSSLKAVTGMDYSAFFTDWVFTAGEPVLQFESVTENDTVKLKYTPVYMPFEQISIPIQIQSAKGLLDTLLPVGKKEVVWDLHKLLGDEVTAWTINPDMTMLVQVREKKPSRFWQKQYENSESVIDRYRAVQGMADNPDDKVEDFLISILENTSGFHALRAEALRQLQAMLSEKEFTKNVRMALKDPDVQLQKEAILLVKNPNSEMQKVLHKLRKGRSYELRQNALHLCVNPKDLKSNQWLYDELYSEEPGIPGRKLEITALLYQILLFKDKEALSTLKRRASPAYDFSTRMNTIQALKSIGYFDRELCGYYFNALFAYNWQLRKEARNLLQAYYKREDEKEVIRQYIREHQNSFTNFQKRVVSATFELNTD
ncbi:MAG: M1 family metallopeptidase [Owenweeksia sp.]